MVSESPQLDPTRSKPCPTLVLGLGNILLRDEGVGVRVVQAMEGVELPRDVELFDGATAGFDLVEILADRRKVIVIDAIEGDSEPGTVLRLSPEELAPRDSQNVSLHEIGVLEALRMVRHIGTPPDEVVIFGVKPKEVSCGLELSPEIDRLVPEIIELVMADLPRPTSADVLSLDQQRKS